MDKLTSDLQGVAVDDILVSGATASEHLQNIRSLLKCLGEKVFVAAWRNVPLLSHP